MISPPTQLSLQRPLRVHVLGSSASVMVQPEHGARDAGTYGEQRHELLAARGVPTVVSHAGTWFGQIRQSLAHYERDVRDHFPDVLVINYGVVECQSNLLPSWLVRHMTTWHRTSRPGTELYRDKVLPKVWPRLRDYQRWASARDEERTYRHRPSRFTADLTRTIDMVRKDCGCLVLLLDIDPPGDRVEHWLPGTTRRVAQYNELLRETAARYDDDVRLVPAGSLLADPTTELPDGLHRSPAGHARTAALLGEQICDWLAA